MKQIVKIFDSNITGKRKNNLHRLLFICSINTCIREAQRRTDYGRTTSCGREYAEMKISRTTAQMLTLDPHSRWQVPLPVRLKTMTPFIKNEHHRYVHVHTCIPTRINTMYLYLLGMGLKTSNIIATQSRALVTSLPSLEDDVVDDRCCSSDLKAEGRRWSNMIGAKTCEEFARLTAVWVTIDGQPVALELRPKHFSVVLVAQTRKKLSQIRDGRQAQQMQ